MISTLVTATIMGEAEGCFGHRGRRTKIQRDRIDESLAEESRDGGACKRNAGRCNSYHYEDTGGSALLVKGKDGGRNIPYANKYDPLLHPRARLG